MEGNMVRHANIPLSEFEMIMRERKVSAETVALYSRAKRKGMTYLPLCSAAGWDGGCDGHGARRPKKK